MYPRVLSYHHQFGVKKRTGKILKVQIDIDDYTPHAEVLKTLGNALDVPTIGRAIEEITSKDSDAIAALEKAGYVNLEVRETSDLGNVPINNWDDKI